MTEQGAKAIVLMATCNGERFLVRQMESIQRQQQIELHVLVRDDGSEDATPSILHSLETRFANVEVLRDDCGRLGYARNFSALMVEACRRRPDYVLLSDQDDLWHELRAVRQLGSLRAMEAAHGRDGPCLSHSDMRLIDADGRPIASSYFARQRLTMPESRHAMACLLAGNFVTGCTIALNRALLELAAPVPDVIRHHDHWLALCAAACGHISCEPEPLVQYRQHRYNAIGGRSLTATVLESPGTLLDRIRRHRQDMRRLPDLVRQLRQRCGERLSEPARELLLQAEAAICGAPTSLARYSRLRALGLRPRGFTRSMLWLMKNLMT